MKIPFLILKLNEKFKKTEFIHSNLADWLISFLPSVRVVVRGDNRIGLDIIGLDEKIPTSYDRPKPVFQTFRWTSLCPKQCSHNEESVRMSETSAELFGPIFLHVLVVEKHHYYFLRKLTTKNVSDRLTSLYPIDTFSCG